MKPVVIANIKGSNGAGKTTIVRQLMEFSPVISYLATDNGYTVATCMDTIKWAAVGKYDLDPSKKMGGCDLMKCNDDIKQAILSVRQACPDYWIVFEGMMVSTLKSTFYNFLADLSAEDNIVPMFVILNADVNTCLEHMKDRGTLRPDINVDNVNSKCELVMRHAKEYDPNYTRIIEVKRTMKSGMVLKFLEAVDDTKLLDWIFINRDVEPADQQPFDREFHGLPWMEGKQT